MTSRRRAKATGKNGGPPHPAGTRAFRRVVVPDRVDLRDRVYMPPVREAPPATLNSLVNRKVELPVMDQLQTSGCTGFALANVVNFLLRVARRGDETPVSPLMAYSMARRYDEFPGENDEGSSLRGAMKGWFRHGVCADKLWATTSVLEIPPAQQDPTKDWWQDAVRRPLGAYYRVDARAVTDMQVGLCEVGVLYASAICHSGWEQGLNLKPKPKDPWVIPYQKAGMADGGHAFVLIGYTAEGFIVLNSWGRMWGADGLGVLTYKDWLEHAMDCWAPQLGVVTAGHETISKAISLRMPQKHQVHVATERVLRDREISPFVIDMENNGRLSQTGEFRTSAGDLESLVTIHLDEFRRQWELAKDDVVDVAIYAHGGLTGEEAAADTASKWIPALYGAKIFPIFLMWETDLFSTLKNKLEDEVEGLAKPTAGALDRLQRWWDQRIEKTLARPGSLIWGEMKQNAQAISSSKESGASILYNVAQKLKAFSPDRVRIHLIGHSAGGIVHSYVVEALAALNWRFKTVIFMAPAVTVAEFKHTVVPRLLDGRVEQYIQFHLSDDQEGRDPTCRPILGYGRSLLYLVSESFEHGVQTPVLGMKKYFDAEVADLVPGRIKTFVAPGSSSESTTHGGFDDDARTLTSVINLIKAAPAGRSRGPAAARKGRTAGARAARGAAGATAAGRRGGIALAAPAVAAPVEGPAGRWFSGLSKIRGRMADLNHNTDPDLKVFSKQTLGELAVSDLIQGNLAQFCQNEQIGMVPTDAFADGTKTFRWLVDRIRLPIETGLLKLMYGVAVKSQSKLLDALATAILPQRLDAVFPGEARTDLDAALRLAVPATFYPPGGSLLQNGRQSVADLIARIMA